MEATFVDKDLVCKECGKTFTLTASNAKWFYENNLLEPKRCPECRKARKEVRK